MTCGSCPTVNPSAARFCIGCGAPLRAGPAGRPGPAGERKQVTILFADIVGSTELIGNLDPEDAQVLLDGAVGVMMDAVRQHGGTVTQTRGDSVVALFGAPIAHEDHAVRACHAALAMQQAIDRDGGASPVRLRVGLNSGEVVVRSTANDLSTEYSAMGQAVHLAARMEQLARPGTVVLTRATRVLVDGHVETRALGQARVKGVPEPVEISELVGAGPVRTGPDAASRSPERPT
jgi:class 3 adenylate cyclase